MALIGYLQRYEPGHLITSAIEHPAVMESGTVSAAPGLGGHLRRRRRLRHGRVEAYEQAFRDDTRLASVMLANNVVGTVQPVKELARIAHEKGAVFHTDAVQVAGSLPIAVDDLGVDLLSISAQSSTAPRASARSTSAWHAYGADHARRRARAAAALGHREHARHRRAGRRADAGRGRRWDGARPRVGALRDRALQGVLAAVPDVLALGHPTERLPGNVAFTVRYIEGESMLLQLDQKGIAVSSGSACASGSLEPSHVILALGLGAEEAHGSLRLSLGRENTEEEVDYFLEVFPPIVDRLRQMSPLYVKGYRCTQISSWIISAIRATWVRSRMPTAPGRSATPSVATSCA